jgi:hypothetical protein
MTHKPEPPPEKLGASSTCISRSTWDKFCSGIEGGWAGVGLLDELEENNVVLKRDACIEDTWQGFNNSGSDVKQLFQVLISRSLIIALF